MTKQHLPAVRILFDWLVPGRVIAVGQLHTVARSTLLAEVVRNRGVDPQDHGSWGRTRRCAYSGGFVSGSRPGYIDQLRQTARRTRALRVGRIGPGDRSH